MELRCKQIGEEWKLKRLVWDEAAPEAAPTGSEAPTGAPENYYKREMARLNEAFGKFDNYPKVIRDRIAVEKSEAERELAAMQESLNIDWEKAKLHVGIDTAEALAGNLLEVMGEIRESQELGDFAREMLSIRVSYGKKTFAAYLAQYSDKKFLDVLSDTSSVALTPNKEVVKAYLKEMEDNKLADSHFASAASLRMLKDQFFNDLREGKQDKLKGLDKNINEKSDLKDESFSEEEEKLTGVVKKDFYSKLVGHKPALPSTAEKGKASTQFRKLEVNGEGEAIEVTDTTVTVPKAMVARLGLPAGDHYIAIFGGTLVLAENPSELNDAEAGNAQLRLLTSADAVWTSPKEQAEEVQKAKEGLDALVESFIDGLESGVEQSLLRASRSKLTIPEADVSQVMAGGDTLKDYLVGKYAEVVLADTHLKFDAMSDKEKEKTNAEIADFAPKMLDAKYMTTIDGIMKPLKDKFLAQKLDVSKIKRFELTLLDAGGQVKLEAFGAPTTEHAGGEPLMAQLSAPPRTGMLATLRAGIEERFGALKNLPGGGILETIFEWLDGFEGFVTITDALGLTDNVVDFIDKHKGMAAKVDKYAGKVSPGFSIRGVFDRGEQAAEQAAAHAPKAMNAQAVLFMLEAKEADNKKIPTGPQGDPAAKHVLSEEVDLGDQRMEVKLDGRAKIVLPDGVEMTVIENGHAAVKTGVAGGTTLSGTTPMIIQKAPKGLVFDLTEANSSVAFEYVPEVAAEGGETGAEG
jgi:hypothetical protein